ncbi:MAG: aminodeoxychorismate/anthranilate synthase component II [Chitinophagia bacterium]|nr:aminodeoxychorismate/anthranilate synthase component II [Chitinophagia bacterium]
MKKLLVLDNYDSFTYNLVHLAKEILEEEIDVFRNDEITIDEASKYEKILLSPGPGIPEEAGILLPLIKALSPTHSILGVCLGHQAIGQVFGGTLTNLSKVYHGVATTIEIEPHLEPSVEKNDWFIGLDQRQMVGRYHSWVVNAEALPEELKVTSKDALGMIMSLRHKTFDVQGVQFHPESVLTENGRQMLENWLK